MQSRPGNDFRRTDSRIKEWIVRCSPHEALKSRVLGKVKRNEPLKHVMSQKILNAQEAALRRVRPMLDELADESGFGRVRDIARKLPTRLPGDASNEPLS